MEPKFQTSFIPKKQIGSDSSRVSVKITADTNIFSLASTLIFLSTALLFGGLFFYKGYLNKQITAADAEVNAARSAIQPEKIKELIDANSRIVASEELLNGHLVTTELLKLLNDSTIRNLRFDDLSYDNKEGFPSIRITGVVKDYNALAYQKGVLAQNELLKDVVFSDIALGENGNVKFALTARLDPRLLSYKKAIETLTTGE